MSSNGSARIGIFPKILFIMLAVSIIPLAVNWYSSNLSHTARITHTVDQSLKDRADALAAFVDGWIEMNVRMLQQNAALPSIRSLDPARQKPVLQSVVRHYDWIYLAFTIDTDGMNVARSDDKGLKDYSDRVYVRQVVAGRDLGQQVLIGRTSGKPSVVLSAPIKEPSQRPGGVLAIGMTLTAISDKIASARIGETGFAFLIDEFGKVIAHPNEQFTNQREDFSNHPAYLKLTPGKQSRVSFTEDGRQIVSFVTPVKQGWSLVVQQDYNEAFAEIEQSNRQALILFAATLVLALVVAIAVSRRLSNPIRRLTQVADEVSRGNFSSQVSDVNRGDELGDLARAIERLGVSVQLATERLLNRGGR